MLLAHDGLNSVWNEAANWLFVDGDDADLVYAVQRARARNRIMLLPNNAQAVVVPQGAPPVVLAEEPEVELGCHELQSKLVVHFSKVKHVVGWARRVARR